MTSHLLRRPMGQRKPQAQCVKSLLKTTNKHQTQADTLQKQLLSCRRKPFHTCPGGQGFRSQVSARVGEQGLPLDLCAMGMRVGLCITVRKPASVPGKAETHWERVARPGPPVSLLGLGEGAMHPKAVPLGLPGGWVRAADLSCFNCLRLICRAPPPSHGCDRALLLGAGHRLAGLSCTNRHILKSVASEPAMGDPMSLPPEPSLEGLLVGIKVYFTEHRHPAPPLHLSGT